MHILRLLNEGIHFDGNNFIINMDSDDSADIIKINEADIFISRLRDYIYAFGYRFDNSIQSEDRAKFLKWIKSTEMTSDIESFILKPIKHLYNDLNIDTIDCIVYPISNRSKLVNNIISTINNVFPRGTIKKSVEIIKNLPENIEFDWDSFNSEYDGEIGDYRYKQIKKYVEKELLPKIHSLEYFSIARDVKVKYRKYISNYLKFKDIDTEQAFKAIQNGNILIVDDINTSGSTISELIKCIHGLNDKCNIYIFTLIGKQF